MNWSEVGNWLKGNAGTGATLIGSLITGNVPGAVAAGVALVSSATGTTDPATAFRALQDPTVQIRLAELQQQEQPSIRQHLAEMAALEYKDAADSHHETQETVRAGDVADDRLVRWTRPLQSWLSLGAALWYALSVQTPSEFVLGALLTLPLSYAGLRGLEKWTARR